MGETGYYLENRAYFTLLEPTYAKPQELDKIRSAISDLIKIDRSLAFEAITFESDLFQVSYDENYNKNISIDLSNCLIIKSKELNPTECKLTISSFGFINLFSKFKYLGETTVNELEKTVDLAIKDIDQLHSLISKILSILIEKDIIRISIQTKAKESTLFNLLENNCLINGHFILAEKLVQEMQIPSTRKENLLSTTCLVLPGAYIYLWSNNDFEILSKIRGVDFYSLSESLFIKTAISIYSEMIDDSNLVLSDSKYFREVYNYLTRIISKISLIEFDLSSEQRMYVQTHRTLSNIIHRNNLLNDIKNATQFIIEGIETDKNQKIGSKIQLILSVFAGITIYSVLNDIISFLNFESFHKSPFLFAKYLILILISITIIGLIYIYKKRLK